MIEEECPMDAPLTETQWWIIYRMSVRQTVTGIIFRALHCLPAQYLPGESLMIRWVAEVDRIERRNRRMNAVLHKLVGLMHGHGLHPVLLKGQGVSVFYKSPLLRESGDIDLFFPSKEEMRKATDLVHTLGLAARRLPDGSLTYVFCGFEVEHHPRMFDLHNPLQQRYLASLLKAHPPVETELRLEGAPPFKVALPAPLPNLLLLGAHLLKHLMGHGVGLRHFCDVAQACTALHGSYSMSEFEAVSKRVGLTGWNRQLYSFLLGFFLVKDAHLPVATVDKEPSPLLMRIVLNGGNFGFHGNSRRLEAQSRRKRKLRTFLAFWKRRSFSLAYARGEAFWTSIRLIIGNIK